ncbi:[protein-PII] uridylyltransferase [Pseudidiomarina donghaiensis]|uniref:Bifunctional uridylyltransferase/uridylyl-removing enzyme n=1 Tax=Pseudidiomarina donghaiensis TaxID=519452 RepID=A0A432XM13_9GAMM|nr:[protein-PII] uridylyltransferase [Pseudidiomarina donghaiensis]RUO49748.1 [protein-PII] uridylyltransferase [Pseudidiomarina donghaiensis]SFV21772.1 UTP--GlnB (protein PII) uridylyltransferase, GlnD [Pseudidiomarina donghaiensis]
MSHSAPPNWPITVTLATGRECLEAYQAWSAEAFIAADIDYLLAHRSKFIDQLLTQLWVQSELPDSAISLIAVGGYGRGTLHPQSDIDLLFLHQQPLSAEQEQIISQFVQMLWDLRLDVGHSVRTPSQCLEQAATDVTVATSLLEQRYICGDNVLAERFLWQMQREFPWTSRAFYQAKYEEQQQRHQRYHGTSYNLEPNVKSNPGGLRDIQTIGWIAKRHFHTQSDESLVQHGYISAEELLELREYQQLLGRIRFALHLEANKKEDRLLFDYQPGVAARLGYGQPGKRAVEAMMKDYFNAVVGVTELNDMLLQFFEQTILGRSTEPKPRPLNEHFEAIGSLIAARHDSVFENRQNLLHCMLLVAQNPHIKHLQAHTIRLLREARRQLRQPLNSDPECRQLFMQLLRHPQGCGAAFRLMHKHQLLANYLPQWQQIVGQMQFDLFHAYTVDEHTFRLVRNLYRYQNEDAEQEFPLCAAIVKRMDKPELLFLAGIFHDIAKGRGGDHSELGEVDALNFARQHELPDADGELIAWLVRHHLIMSVTAQKRDIHDPEVVRDFAATVKTQRRLDYLYCLTVADIRATNSSLWNNWKASLLENLYQATTQFLATSKTSAANEMRQRVHQHQAHAMGLLLSLGFSAQSINELWSRFTADYFLRHQPEQIAWHSQYILPLQDDEQLPLILVGDESNQGTTELFVYHLEHENLFAAVAAVLDSQALSIHDAQILATRDGYVMDTFVVLQDDGEPLTDVRRIESLKQQLHDVLRQRQPAPSAHRRLPRQLRNFTVTTKVEFVSERNPRRTAFELTALDRPGLVARVAKVLQQLDLNILTAKITTVGEQAEDLFIVTTRRNEALSDEQKQQLKKQIVAALNR